MRTGLVHALSVAAASIVLLLSIAAPAAEAQVLPPPPPPPKCSVLINGSGVNYNGGNDAFYQVTFGRICTKYVRSFYHERGNFFGTTWHYGNILTGKGVSKTGSLEPDLCSSGFETSNDKKTWTRTALQYQGC